MINYIDIKNALTRIGVGAGDICLFHSSFKSLGEVENGAEDVIRGFEAALGEKGTLAVPTLVSADFFNSYKTWHLDKPSEVGYLTEYFRKLPGVLRSDQATHSVAARGALAYELTHEHTAYGPHLCPFGEYAFADSSPWMKLYKLNAKVVFVGVTMKYNTLKHLIEATLTERLLSEVKSEARRKELISELQTFDNRWQGVWLYYNAEKMQEHLDSLGLVRKTQCGSATLVCVDARTASDAALNELYTNCRKWYSDKQLEWIEKCKNS